MKSFGEFLNERKEDAVFQKGDWLFAKGGRDVDFYYSKTHTTKNVLSTYHTKHDKYIFVVEVIEAVDKKGKMEGHDVFYKCRIQYKVPLLEKKGYLTSNEIFTSVYENRDKENAHTLPDEVIIPENALYDSDVTDKLRDTEIPKLKTIVELRDEDASTSKIKFDRTRMGTISGLALDETYSTGTIHMLVEREGGDYGIPDAVAALSNLKMSNPKLSSDEMMEAILKKSGFEGNKPNGDAGWVIECWFLSILAKTGGGNTISINAKFPTQERANQVRHNILKKIEELGFLSSQPISSIVDRKVIPIYASEQSRIHSIAKNAGII